MRKLVYVLQTLSLLFLLLTAVMIMTGHAMTTSQKHKNSLGVIQYEDNPNTYIEGAVTNAALVGDGINLRIQPRGTYGLFTQELLFCDTDDVVLKFAGKNGLVVLTYSTVAHRTIQGIGCHDLRSVDNVTVPHE